MTHQVTIEKFPPERGRRKIVVDGQHWGTISMSTHGCHGAKYTFFQMVGDKVDWGNALVEPHDDPGRRRTVCVWGDKGRQRSWSGSHGKDDTRPTEEVLLDVAMDVVTRGVLRDPAVVKAERAAAHKKWTDARVAERLKERERDRDRVITIVDRYHAECPDPVARVTMIEALTDLIQTGRSE